VRVASEQCHYTSDITHLHGSPQLLQDLLDNWLTCQATWQYLEPIFSSPDILKQMPEEGEKFAQASQQPALQLALQRMCPAGSPCYQTWCLGHDIY